MTDCIPICIWNRGSDQYFWATKYIDARDPDPDVPSGPHPSYGAVLDDISDFLNCDKRDDLSWKPCLGEVPERHRGKF